MAVLVVVSELYVRKIKELCPCPSIRPCVCFSHEVTDQTSISPRVRELSYEINFVFHLSTAAPNLHEAQIQLC